MAENKPIESAEQKAAREKAATGALTGQQRAKGEYPGEHPDKPADDYYGRETKYIDDAERRRAVLNLSEEETAKFKVTDATPASGGVYPPSALEEPAEAATTGPDPQTPADMPAPGTPPAATTTPAAKK